MRKPSFGVSDQVRHIYPVCVATETTRDRLIEINNVVSQSFFKILNANNTNTLIFFVEKNVRIFCSAKDSHIFPTKNNGVFDNVVGIYLTS